MSPTEDRLLTFVASRLESMLRRPTIWGVLADRPRYPLAALLGRAGNVKPSRSSRHFHDCAQALGGAVDRLHEIAEVVLRYEPPEAETLMTKALEITLDETFHISGADLLFPQHR